MPRAIGKVSDNSNQSKQTRRQKSPPDNENPPSTVVVLISYHKEKFLVLENALAHILNCEK